MATQLSIVNRVLRRLREDVVTATTDNDYSELIADFVADAVSEVQDAHDWEACKHTVDVDIVDGTSDYELTATVANGGNVRNSADRVCNVESELLFLDHDVAQVWIRDSDSDELGANLKFVTPEVFRQIKEHDLTETNDDPCYFTIQAIFNETNDTNKLYLKLYPEPDAARVITLTFWTPVPELLADGTTDTQNIIIPTRPVFQLALMYAFNERGEEIGEPGNLAEQRFHRAMTTAVERDISMYGKADRYDWRRD
jgi:hypothetical protein